MVLIKLLLIRGIAKLFGRMATPGSWVGPVVAATLVTIGFIGYRMYKKKKAAQK